MSITNSVSTTPLVPCPAPLCGDYSRMWEATQESLGFSERPGRAPWQPGLTICPVTQAEHRGQRTSARAAGSSVENQPWGFSQSRGSGSVSHLVLVQQSPLSMGSLAAYSLRARGWLESLYLLRTPPSLCMKIGLEGSFKIPSSTACWKNRLCGL